MALWLCSHASIVRIISTRTPADLLPNRVRSSQVSKYDTEFTVQFAVLYPKLLSAVEVLRLSCTGWAIHSGSLFTTILPLPNWSLLDLTKSSHSDKGTDSVLLSGADLGSSIYMEVSPKQPQFGPAAWNVSEMQPARLMIRYKATNTARGARCLLFRCFLLRIRQGFRLCNNTAGSARLSIYPPALARRHSMSKAKQISTSS